MLLNALNALENRPGDDSRLIARLWVMRATVLLKEAPRTADSSDPESVAIDRLLATVSERLRAHASGAGMRPEEGRFSRLSRKQSQAIPEDP